MKILRSIALALLLLAPLPAAAQQSSPGWTFGYVPSPAEWSFWFGKKVDWQGAAYCPISGCTFTGPLLTAPSTTLGAGINIGQGVAPTTPNNGDIWITASGFFVRFNGATVQLSTPGSAFLVTSSSANSLTVGPNGVTNPVFNVDDSIASAATGISVQGLAVGAGVNVSVISGGTNEALNLNAKGTGAINVTTPTFNVGAGGATNPALSVIDPAGSATGISITGTTAGSGVTLGVTSSGSNENLTINAKGTGTISVGFCTTTALILGCTSATSGAPDLQLTNTTSDAGSAGVILTKNRAGGVSNSGDSLGMLVAQGFANAAQQSAAEMLAAQTAAATGSNIPTKLELQTSNSAGLLNQKIRFDQNAHLAVTAQATAPTITAGCNGAGASITGSGSTNDTHGTVTGQTAAATTCTVTFGTAFAAAPDCTFIGFQSAITVVNSVGTGTFQVTFASTASYKFSYHCNGA